jgi:hypothetical protein
LCFVLIDKLSKPKRLWAQHASTALNRDRSTTMKYPLLLLFCIFFMCNILEVYAVDEAPIILFRNLKEVYDKLPKFSGIAENWHEYHELIITIISAYGVSVFDDTFSATHHAAGSADDDPFTLNADNYTETTWKAASQIIYLFMLWSTTGVANQLVLTCQRNGFRAITQLKEKFTGKSLVASASLLAQLMNYKLTGLMDPDEFMTKMTRLFEAYNSSVGPAINHLPNGFLLNMILTGLPDTYSEACTSIRENEITDTSVIVTRLRERCRVLTFMSSNNKINKIAEETKPNTTKRKLTNVTKLFCELCKKGAHTAEDCWFHEDSPSYRFCETCKKSGHLKETCRIGKNKRLAKKDNKDKKQRKTKIAYIGGNKPGTANQDVVEYTDDENSDDEN